MKNWWHIALIAILAFPTAGFAQSTSDHFSEDKLERAIEKLVAFGVVDNIHLNSRPWSRAEAGRLITEARKHVSRLDGENRQEVDYILSTLETIGIEQEFEVQARIDGTLLDSPWKPVPSETGADRIDAQVNHLVRYDDGREFVDGRTWGGELDVFASPNDHVSLEVRPRFWLNQARDDDTEGQLRLLNGLLAFKHAGVKIDVGRSTPRWGPGKHGGTLLTNNAQQLDRVRVSSETPFHWPFFLSILGPSQAEAFFAILESDRDVPHSKLVGYTVSIRPHPLWEAAFSALIQSGGEGAPDASFGERVADHLLFFDWLVNRDSDFLSSNKASSLSLSVRVPSLRNTEIFAEHTIEDPARNMRRLFWQDAAWLVGVWVPRLDQSGHFDLRAEFHHGGVRLHRHGQFTSGRTVRQRIIGMGGPDTNSGFVEVGLTHGPNYVSLELGIENRSADQWSVIESSSGGIGVWKKVDDGPDERSFRAVCTLERSGSGSQQYFVRAGVEYTTNDRFNSAENDLNRVLQVGVTLSLASTSR